MTLFDRIKGLADKQGKNIKTVALDIGLSENAIYGWKKTKPKADDLAKVADYFHVTVDFLLGREGLEIINEPIDLAQLVDDSKVDWDKWVSFEGKPLSDDLKIAMKLILGKRLEDK